MKEKRGKIKVCFFSPESYPFFWEDENAIHGGAEFQMFLLAKYLANKSDVDISFIIGDYPKSKNTTLYNIKLIRGFKLNPNDNVISKISKAIKYIILIKRIKPDFLITTTANVLVGVTAIIKKFIGLKHIHRTAHLIDVDRTWIKQNEVLGKMYEYGLNRVEIVLTQNKEHSNLLKINHQIDAVIFKNGFETKVGSTFYNKEGVLWVGRFVEWKQPYKFIEIAGKLPDINFTMICPYLDEDKNEWAKLKVDCEKTPNLRLIKKVPFNEIQKYFDKAKIFVNTSLSEGFPNTFLQAAAGKTPIVSLNIDPDNFINKNKCGVCCKGDFQLMINTINKIDSKTEILIEYGENVNEYLRKEHNIKQITDQLYNIITKQLVCVE